MTSTANILRQLVAKLDAGLTRYDQTTCQLQRSENVRAAIRAEPGLRQSDYMRMSGAPRAVVARVMREMENDNER